MIVTKINDGEYAEYSLDGVILKVDAMEYDLENLQQDEQNIIDIKADDRFIANIIIPPAQYKEIDSGDIDDNGEVVYERVKAALDTEAVKLNLWAIQKNENQNTQGEL